MKGLSEEEKEELKGSLEQALRAFEKALTQARTLSFYTYCEMIRSLPSAARRYRVLAGGQTIRLGLIELRNGNYTQFNIS